MLFISWINTVNNHRF